MTTLPLQIEGSTFQGFAVWLTHRPTIELAYVKVRQAVSNADHIMVAYVTDDLSGSCDDGEYHGDLEMLSFLKNKQMQNVATFITRKKGPLNIGKLRFQAICDIMSNLNDMFQENPCAPVDHGWSPWEDSIDDYPDPIDDPTSASALLARKSRAL